jgi:DNA-binding HxlR family transcriptional regulator
MEKQAARPPCSTEQLEDALKALEGRWKTLIIFHLFGAPALRFSELHRAIPGVSQKMLIQQLRNLEGNGIVTRKVHPEVPPKVEYSLSEAGLALRPALVALQTWAASPTNRRSGHADRGSAKADEG